MKTCKQVARWCQGAAQEFGDPSVPVCQVFARWQEDLKNYKGEDLAFGWLDGELVIWLGPDFPILPLRVELGQLQIGEHGELKSFGAMQVTTGVWWLTPSLNAGGIIHAYLVIYGVPDPAPWERRIVLA